MLVARVLYPVLALGPGRRIGIWVCGCNRRCFRCANPELQAFDERREIAVPELIEAIDAVRNTHPVDGVTISGGEPFEQAEALLALTKNLVTWTRDILVFSGYTLEALNALPNASVSQALSHIAVLVDGEYIDDQNTGSVLRGSDNQRVHIFSPDLAQTYAPYLNGERQFQTFSTTEGVFAIGLHYKGFRDELETAKHRHSI